MSFFIQLFFNLAELGVGLGKLAIRSFKFLLSGLVEGEQFFNNSFLVSDFLVWIIIILLEGGVLHLNHRGGVLRGLFTFLVELLELFLECLDVFLSFSLIPKEGFESLLS